MGAPPPKSGAPRFFKPQGNSIIPKRKFVMTFQKRRARRGAPFCVRRYAKAVSKKRRDRVYAGRGKRCGRLGSASAVLSSCQLCAHICFARPFGGALAPLGSPPGRLPLSNYSGAEFLPRLFFSNSRPQNRGAARGLLPPRKAILSFAHINL